MAQPTDQAAAAQPSQAGMARKATRAWRWLRSLAFSVTIYALLPVISLAYAPWAAVDRRGAFAAIRAWCGFVRWLARWLIGLRTEIRGQVPTGEVMIASKHQSFLDIIMICSVVPRPKFVMKAELTRVPFIGWYAKRIGCVPVDRGKRGQAIPKLLADVAAGRAESGQLIIYPQGTRVAPGIRAPYKAGAGAIYAQAGQACVPTATNVGLFWPRRAVMREPGRAIVAFLPEIPSGQETGAFMRKLEDVVEEASDALAAEVRA